MKAILTKKITLFSLAVLCIVLLIQYIWLDIINSVLIFFIPILWLGIGIAFIIGAIRSVMFFTRKRNELEKSYLPMIVYLIIIACIIFDPLGEIRIYADFYSKLTRRMEIVEKIEKGDIAYDFRNTDLAKLPKEYRDLSVAQIPTGHNIVAVENVKGNKCVYFYIFKGMTDNDQGFVYVPDDSIIDTMKIGVSYRHNIFYELSGKRKIKKHWYLISNT